MSKKTCSRCGLEKPLRDFYRQAGGAQGRRSRCKSCYKELERESYARDPEVQARRRQILSGGAMRGWVSRLLLRAYSSHLVKMSCGSALDVSPAIK